MTQVTEETGAQKLRQYIEDGDSICIQKMLDPVSDVNSIRNIEDEFIQLYGTDPVNCAINNREEKIGIYLVEKAFSIDKLYQWPEQQCDKWCSYDHGFDRCGAEFTAEDNAQKKNLYKLQQLIEEINHGLRKPGEGLPTPSIYNHMPKPPTKSNKPKYDRPVNVVELKKKTDAEEARAKLLEFGCRHVDKEGNTLLHLNIHRPAVYTYVFTSGGVPVNIQNTNGDTALHLAIRAGLKDIVEALIQSSADTGIRNNMGQSPYDESEGKIRAFLNGFQPGVVEALCKGKVQVFDRIVRPSWASVISKVKDDSTLLKLAFERSKEMPQVQNCVRILQDFRSTSRLIHAVLSEDVETVRDILTKEKGWTTNLRFRNNKGKTLLSHAIDSNNLEIVKLLVDEGNAKIDGVRVPENEDDGRTMPLFQRCLKKGINPDIARFLNARMDSLERAEKDSNGNTAILRAIEEGCSQSLISWLVNASGGNCLFERNKDGKTPREIALERENDQLLKTINKCIVQRPTNIDKYSINFCSEKTILEIKDEESGRTFRNVVQDRTDINDVDKWLLFQDIQNDAEQLSVEAAKGNVKQVEKLFKERNVKYKDKNGYTALTRALVFQQLDVCRFLCTTRPFLKGIPDNCNRYPLHYAYCLPDKAYVDLLLEKNSENIEKKVDKDGRTPADYKCLRDTTEMLSMLYEARTRDVWGKRCPPLAPWPKGAETAPPDKPKTARSAAGVEINPQQAL